MNTLSYVRTILQTEYSQTQHRDNQKHTRISLWNERTCLHTRTLSDALYSQMLTKMTPNKTNIEYAYTYVHTIANIILTLSRRDNHKHICISFEYVYILTYGHTHRRIIPTHGQRDNHKHALITFEYAYTFVHANFRIHNTNTHNTETVTNINAYLSNAYTFSHTRTLTYA